MSKTLYRGGQEPRDGDIVRSLKDLPHGPRKVGDVFTVLKMSPYGKGVYYNGFTHGAPNTFELIARAGEPVIYQPGDVVECIEADTVPPPHRGKVGERYVVTSTDGGLTLAGEEPGYNSRGCMRSRFKLVRRPDAAGLPSRSLSISGHTGYVLDIRLDPGQQYTVKGGIDVAEAPTKEPLTFTPPEPQVGVDLAAEPQPKLQVGDRVKVTVTGEVKRIDGDVIYTLLDGGKHATPLTAKELAAGTVKVKSRPLAVGDRVIYRDKTEGELLAVCGDQGWLKEHDGLCGTVMLNALRRIS